MTTVDPARARALIAHLKTLTYRWECDNHDCDGLPHDGWLHHHARAKQRTPEGAWRTWLLLAGRGFGKTRSAAEAIRRYATRHCGASIAVVAKKETLARELCFEGISGLLAVIPPEQVDTYLKSSPPTLRLTNGSVIRGFSSEVPDNLRGWAFDAAWVDEYAAFHPKLAQDVMDMLWFCLRESADPRVIVSTTPKPLAHVKKLVEDHKAGRGGIVIVNGHTRDNAPNLSPIALEKLEEDYEGTRLGLQELSGQLLTDVPGALWRAETIEYSRVTADQVPALVRIVVGVDPSVTATEASDECGIIVAGIDTDHHMYVLGDYSGIFAGMAAAMKIWDAYEHHGAHLVVWEDNAGKQWVREMLTIAWQARGHVSPPPLMSVTAKLHKRVRAMPAAARYEQHKVSHVGEHAVLEHQMTTWDPDVADGPDDRIDGLVHALAELAAVQVSGLGMYSGADEWRDDLIV